MARTRELKVIIAGDADRLNRELKRSGDGLDRFGKQTRLTASVTSKGFHGMRAAATGLTAGIAGAALAAKSFVDAASDVNESLTKNEALFGKSAKTIDRFSKTTATTLGISRREALAAAGTFGGLFDAIDIGEKKSAGMSKRLVTLAADLASFNNASPEDALEALRSGLSGEAEPMRRFNAFLSETRVKAEAASLGIGKVAADTGKIKIAQEQAQIAQERYNIAVARYSASSIEARTAHIAVANAQERAKKATQGGTVELTEAQKVQARYSLILKDTAAAQGDAIKTGNGFANQQRRLKAQVDDLKSSLGQELLPTVEKGTRALNKFVEEMRNGTGDGGRFVDTLKSIWQEVEPIVLWVGRATKNIVEFAEQHPKVTRLAAEIIAVGLAVKGLKFVSAATGFTDLLKAGRVAASGLRRVLTRGGAAAGEAAAAEAAGSFAGTTAASARWDKAGKLVGKKFGKGLMIGAVAGMALLIPDLVKWLDKSFLTAPKRLGESIGARLGKLLGTDSGDGTGGMPSGGKAGNLMGARRSLAPFAAQASMFGLHVSSGKRPGAITSSGNVSYHSTGEAIDVAGPKLGMMGFARSMRDRYGSRLAELIYTPMGAGVKNGSPHRYTGQVAADHYDHVHVALDTGRPGVGDGLGKFQSTAYGPPWGGIQGTGVTAAGVNLKGSPHIYGVAADPRVLPLGTRVRISPNPFGYTGAFKVFDTGGAIKGNRIDFYDWRGRASQNAWGRRSVTVSRTGSSGGSGGSSGVTSEAVQTKIDANQRRLDALHTQLDRAPKGLAGAVQRDHIEAQIRSLNATQRNLRGDLRDAPTAAERTEAQEKAGSRLVSRIVAPFMKGFRTTSSRARDLGEQIDRDETTYGQAERFANLTDEDLGTAGGRARRISELKKLAGLKAKTLKRQKQRAQALQRAIKNRESMLRKLNAARRKLKGAKRSKVNERIRSYEESLDDLKAELQALGFAITDTQLDIGDLAKDAQEVAGTPDTEVEAGPTAGERTDDLVSLIDDRERAGVIDAATATAQRAQVRQGALAGALGPLSERERLKIMGDLREATTQAAEQMSANTQALKDLQDEIARNTAVTETILATSYREALRALADSISGDIVGRGVNPRALTAGSGALARY